MPFAVVVYFDPRTEGIIHDAWKTLADQNIDPYLFRSDNRPHVKLEMYESFDAEKSRERLRQYAGSNRKTEIQFKLIGIFPLEKPVVFLGAATGREWIDMKMALNDLVGDISTGMSPQYFQLGSWTPDCQLTVGVEKGKLNDALRIAMEIPIPLAGTVTEIGVIEFHPAKRLFSFPFEE